MVLILHVQLHGGLNQNGGGHDIGLVVCVQVVQEVTAVLLGCVHGLVSTKELRLGNVVLRACLVLRTLKR